MSGMRSGLALPDTSRSTSIAKTIPDSGQGMWSLVHADKCLESEIKQREADAIAYAKAKADEEQAAAEKAEAKAAIADRLGLTPDELALLLA